MTLYSTNQVAEICDISPQRVRQLAVQERRGRKVGKYGGVWVFDDTDLLFLQLERRNGRPPGRPRKVVDTDAPP